MQLDPIGTFHCPETYPYDAARQGAVAGENRGVVELFPGQNFEQALQDLEGFSHVWLIYAFHENPDWKPMIQPPRGDRKVGVFATRAPYRPNPIGLSCVRLVSVKGRRIEVAGHDLLDGTPILDLKPYIPYADSFPEATTGWLEEIDTTGWELRFSEKATEQLDWLQTQGVDCLDAFLHTQLGTQPTNAKKKRVRELGDQHWEIAYRTWRIDFRVNEAQKVIGIESIYSGYNEEELESAEDPYGDKAVHREYDTWY